MAHAAQHPTLRPLYRPLLQEVRFGFVDQLSDVNGPRGAVFVRPVEAHHGVRRHVELATFTGAHATLLFVDDVSFPQDGRVCLGSALLIALYTVAEFAQGGARGKFPPLGFRTTVIRPPLEVATPVHFRAFGVVGFDVFVRAAARARVPLSPLEPDLPALSYSGVGVPFGPVGGIPTRLTQHRQLGPAGVRGLELALRLHAEASRAPAMSGRDVLGRALVV